MKFHLAVDIDTREYVWARNVIFQKRPNYVKIHRDDKIAYILEVDASKTFEDYVAQFQG